MSAPLIFLALDVAVVVCAGLIGLRALFMQPRTIAALLVAAISVSMVCAVVLGRQDYAYWTPPAFRVVLGAWTPVFNLARNLAPGLLMLLCHSLFTDRRRFPPWLLGLLAVQLLLEEPGRELVAERLVTQIAPALLQTLFVGAAVYWTLVDWRADLVESRRRTRALMLLVIGLSVVLTVLLTRVIINPNSVANYAAHVALTASYLPIQALVLFQLVDGSVLGEVTGVRERRPAPDRLAAAQAERRAALARLRALLDKERVCLEPELSLQRLADRVGLPVYRLRRLIHEELGYRNFNALLHDHRVREACAQLSDPAQRRTPILTIALSVGYASVTTFNRGFREIMRVTPSAYRSLRLSSGAAESE